MNMHDIPGSCREAEKRIVSAGIPLERLYELAGIHRTTWMRMREGKLDPRVSTYAKAVQAVESLLKRKRG